VAAHPTEGLTIRFSDERQQLLETGGGIRKARPLLGEGRILVHNCDILSNADLKAFWAKGEGAAATLMVSERETTRYLLFDDDLRLQGWTNIETGEVKGRVGDRRLAFSGIHVLWPTIFPLLEQMPERFPIMDFYLKVCADCLIRGYEQKDLRLLDVGKLDTLDQANEFITK
jgi:NDP-sugar pyrophosphorylase family protein